MRHVSLFLAFLAAGGFPEMAAQTSESAELIVPVAVNGTISGPLHFQTTFTFVNLSDSAIDATIVAYDDQGVLQSNFFWPCKSIQVPESGRMFTLAPSGTLQANGSSIDFAGWARISLSRNPESVQGSAEVTLLNGEQLQCSDQFNRSTKEIIATARIPAVKPAKKFRARALITPHRQTAIAIVNPSSTDTATVEVSLTRWSAADSKTVLTVQPLRRTSKFLLDLVRPEGFPPQGIPETFPHFHGSVTISSNIPIAVGVLDVLSPEVRFLHVPTTAVIP